MTVGQIFTKIGNFIENRQIFMLLNCNCTKLANFKHAWGGVISWTQCSYISVGSWVVACYYWYWHCSHHTGTCHLHQYNMTTHL